KTLRGPRGGMILARENAELARRLDAMVFPGTQGGPLMHVIAAKAVAFLEAQQPEFREYQRAVLANAERLARYLMARGYEVASGGTDNHMLIVALPDGREVDEALERAHIAVNAMSLPRPGSAVGALR